MEGGYTPSYRWQVWMLWGETPNPAAGIDCQSMVRRTILSSGLAADGSMALLQDTRSRPFAARLLARVGTRPTPAT